jgi:hypothetical protein
MIRSKSFAKMKCCWMLDGNRGWMRVELKVWEKGGVVMGEGVGVEESGDGEEKGKGSGSRSDEAET